MALRILIVSDGRPGHFNLSEGIAAALGRLRSTTVERLDVRRGRWPGSIVAALATAHLPAARMLRQVYGVDPNGVPQADVIVSAGAETLGASIWLSRIRGAPNIHYGSVRLFDPQDFSLVLTSYRRKADRPRHALALKPSRIDPDSGRPYGTPTAAGAAGDEGKQSWPPRRAALVLGGDARGVTFTDADWQALLRVMTTMSRTHRTVWHVANSRRTPAAVSHRLVEAASQPANGIGQFLDVRDAGPGTLTPLLAGCDLVLCTADSSSMVSECVWMRLPTIAVSPETFALPRDEQAYRDWMHLRKWVTELPISRLSPETIENAARSLRPNAANPQQMLAALIAERVPELTIP